jgi:hypothetical protein
MVINVLVVVTELNVVDAGVEVELVEFANPPEVVIAVKWVIDHWLQAEVAMAPTAAISLKGQLENRHGATWLASAPVEAQTHCVALMSPQTAMMAVEMQYEM